MQGKSPKTSDLIAEAISETGSINVAQFLELALYHPQAGYYGSGRAAIGKAGDFFTNVSVGPLFGRLLAGQFEEMWRRLDCPASFQVVEQGANDGQLAADILKNASEPFATALHYRIVEPLAPLREKQSAILEPWKEKVSWASSLDELPAFVGVHFSNELIDALPFHLVECHEGRWEELMVVGEAPPFSFRRSAPSPAIAEEVSILPARANGTLAELRPAARRWLLAVEEKLTAGYVLIVDYGYDRATLLSPHRTKGTFACYRQHRRDDKVLEDAGEKDITAHVDFTQLAETALASGLTIEGYTDQHRFIVGAAESLLLSLEGAPPDEATRKTLRAVQTLMHPESMGTQFRYLGLSRNVPAGDPLTGFKHARNPSTELFANADHLI